MMIVGSFVNTILELFCKTCILKMVSPS